MQSDGKRGLRGFRASQPATPERGTEICLSVFSQRLERRASLALKWPAILLLQGALGEPYTGSSAFGTDDPNNLYSEEEIARPWEMTTNA